MNEQDYFDIFRSAIKVRNKRVLEIGGAVPPETIATAGVASWTSIDITENRFQGLERPQGLPDWYRPIVMDAASMTFADDTFDLVYTTNCFEHVWNLSSVLNEVYRVLKPQGVLFTVFSPIWSAPVGHHTWVWDGDKALIFDQNLFPDWYHLVKTRKELAEYLTDRYSADIVEKICRMVYESDNINRLVDTDYERAITQLDFATVVKYRIRSRKKPDADLLEQLKRNCPGVTSFQTLGYFWILCKGKAGVSDRLRAYGRGGFAAVKRKLAAKA